ncbi:MAG: serine dehydratase subunit alpha family protein, partial [Parabacteroides sp.]|nr:serine dehydratase subunit alpha family protein [Parabacteroides sp.]
MNDTTKNQILKLIHQEVIPAIGCTEPIAVALAAAKAAELLGTKPEKIDVYLSANILKNAMGVGIPGTGMVGLPIAIALGVLIGKSSYELEVLKDVTPEALEAGKQLIHDQVIHIALKENVDKLYIEVVCQAGDSKSVAVIAHEHTRFVYCSKDDQVLLDERKSLEHTDEGEDDELKLSFDLVYDFAIHTPLDEIRFILDTARLNKKAAEESVKGQFGHAVSKTISGPIGKKYLGDSSYT